MAGRTPNPDILCNREIKFDIFLKAALALGADYVATGHYAQKRTSEDGIHHLIAGIDKSKDQSYFLCQLNQEQLSKAIFPIGHLHKSKVREIAIDLELVTATKKDSQGLCFIGKVSLPDFLQQKLKPQKGEIIEVEASWQGFESPQWGRQWPLKSDLGKVVGSHNGAYYFTIGQRRGLFVGGKNLPLFVIALDVEKNIVYVGQGENHPGLYRPFLKIHNSDIHWVNTKKKMKVGESCDYMVRIRYRQKLFSAKIELLSDGLKIQSNEPMKSVTPGQFASWYDGDELVGSGIIQN